MAEGDEDKMAFFAGEEVFCYRKMPFGLKNTRATYQRLVDKVFHDQIMRNLKAYVNDMEIRANLLKVKAITDFEQPKMLKDIQSLNGKIAALSRFLSNGAERSLPFFKVLKSYIDKKNIQWTQEAKAALQEMKKFVEILPTLTAPIQGEVLIIVLQGAKLNYPGLEKLILALVHAARMLQRYFQAHTAIELGEHDIAFQKRGDETPKDFLMEVPPKDNRKEIEGRPDTNTSQSPIKEVNRRESKEGKSWMTPIYEYLVSGLLPKDLKESRKIRVEAPQYKLIRGSLYQRSFYTLWLRYVASPQTENIVKEIQEGSCGFNAEPQSMVVRITKHRYY
ncbi:hypothetical protein Tco_0730344 [Tanacetum coccineum]|uniref:Reverse transcriptase domain-containing protein n=1 Tax=Tanacetum coccineum TaxID=301880 RepID=A0ABQ4YUJ8_9ASTR